MSETIDAKVECVFVNYKFEPFTCHNQEALYEFLLQEVWSQLADPCEDIRPEKKKVGQDCVSQIRYQFPDVEQAYDRCNEVGALLAQAIEKWRVVGQWRE